MQGRAYSLITEKALDDGRRIFKGIATTPTPDRVQDVINPLGAKFKNPLALLHQHDHRKPIGTVRFSKPTEKGIEFEAEIPVIEEPGELRERVETAWGEIKAGLVRAVSIGFRPIADPVFNKHGGVDFPEIEIYELSTVSVPANPDAVISEIKSIDKALRKQLGLVEETDQLPKQQAAIGKALPVVKLGGSARDRAKPYVIRKIHV